MTRRLSFVLCLLFFQAALAGDGLTPEQEQRAKALAEDLRCLVCQNQSIAESNADLAQDLRDQVTTMVGAGASDEDVIRYMVERYGDFVLYKPPVKPATYLLWFGPLILLALGAVALARSLVLRRRTSADAPLSESERRRLDELLGVDAEERRP